MMQNICSLLSVTDSYFDELGQLIEEETEKLIFCELGPITRSEWLSAGQMGFKPSIMLKVYDYEYEGESDVIFNGTRYSVYRTYRPQYGNIIELYLEIKVGDDNG